jgi:ketosteroid isomerase-like protein
MSQQQENLRRVKAAYAAWNDTKGGNVEDWLALIGDKFHLASIDENTPGMEFAKDGVSKEEARAYLTGIFNDWEMVRYTPSTFVAEGDNIAMFGTCAYRHKKTRKLAECHIASLWKFEGDKAVELTDIFDTAKAMAAAMP